MLKERSSLFEEILARKPVESHTTSQFFCKRQFAENFSKGGNILLKIVSLEGGESKSKKKFGGISLPTLQACPCLYDVDRFQIKMFDFYENSLRLL